MRRTLLIFGLLVICLMSTANAQSTEGVITGKILDQEQKPLPNASVAVYDSAQSSVINGTSSKMNGAFSVDLMPGQYVLKITFLSYKAIEKRVRVQGGQRKSLGNIEMQPTAENLGEVFVRAERSQMQMNFDKRTFQVGKDITSLGGSAVDVLNNVPSVATDIDGNISLRGNEAVRVLINGKPSSMASGDADALRSIPANMIKEVKIITNPSSKYAAEGSAGIINIILKKEKKPGLNGNISAGTGYPQQYEGSANLNYRINKVNLFVNEGLDYRTEPEGGSSFQRFSGPDTSYMYSEQTDATESEIDGDLRFGADFFLSDKEVLTASAYLSAEEETNTEDLTYTDFKYQPDGFGGEVLMRTFRDNNEKSTERDFDLNLDYENKFDGDDHKLTADASFDISRENAGTNIEETIQQGTAEPLFQRTEDGEKEMDLRINAEYKRLLGSDGKFEAGIRSDTEWIDNSYRVEEQQNGNWVSLPAYNDNFRYLENVNAAFAILGQEWGNFSGQIGLRLENTRIRTEVKSTNLVNDQNYLNLFPSAFLSYSFNDRQSVQLSYSRRLSRPWSRALIPFVDFEDSRSQFTGNPNLTPELSNSYEAGYLHYWKSGSLMTSFYYRYRTDVIERITEQNQGVIRIFPINLATEKSWGMELSADQKIANSLNLTANANLYRSNSDGSYEGQIFESESENFQARTRLRWEITGEWNYQASVRYRGPRETTQGRRESLTIMDTGLSRDLLDGKAKVSLNIRDVLDSQNFNNTVTSNGNPNTDFYSQREFSWSSRTFSLNFQYFFGEKDKRRGSSR